MKHSISGIVFLGSVAFLLLQASCASMGFTQRQRPGSSTASATQASAMPSAGGVSSSRGTDAVASNNTVSIDSLLEAASTSSAKTTAPSTTSSTEPETELSPEDMVCLQSAVFLGQAVDALTSELWNEAVTNAVAASDCPEQAQTAYDIAFGAATMLDRASLQMGFMFATSPIARSVYGLEMLRGCIASHDAACISANRDSVLDALRQSGLENDADALQAQLDGMQSGGPVAAVLLPLSGRDRKMGRAMLGAFLHAAGIYSHTGIAWDLRFFDTASDPGTVTQLVHDAAMSGAAVILGPLDVQEAQAAASAVRSDNLVMVSFAPNGSFLNERSFQLSYSLDEEAAAVAKTAMAEGLRKVVSVFPEGRFGDTMASMLEKQAASIGAGRLAMSRVVYPAEQVDLRTIAAMVVKQEPDAIFLPTDVSSAERFLSFLAQENMWCRTTASVLSKKSPSDTRKWVTCLGSSSWAPIPRTADYKFIRGARYLSYTASVSKGDELANSFEKLYHREPNVYEMIPYAAIETLNALPMGVSRNPGETALSIQAAFGGSSSKMLFPTFVEVIQ